MQLHAIRPHASQSSIGAWAMANAKNAGKRSVRNS
jgi:hypothetical protein